MISAYDMLKTKSSGTKPKQKAILILGSLTRDKDIFSGKLGTLDGFGSGMIDFQGIC